MSPISEGSSSSSRSRRIVIAFDATKNSDFQEFRTIISKIKSTGDIIQERDTITVFGVLHKALHPLGFHIEIGRRSFVGAHTRAIKEEVSRKVDACAKMLQQSAKELKSQRVDIAVKIVVGSSMKHIVIREIASSAATWAILDRKLRKELDFYLENISCKVATVLDDLSLEVLRKYNLDMSIEPVKVKLFYSLSKSVSLPPDAVHNDSVNRGTIYLSPSPLKAMDPPKGILKKPKPPQKENNIDKKDEAVPKVDQEEPGNCGQFGKDSCNNSGKVTANEESPLNLPIEYVPSPAFEIQIDKDSIRQSNLLPDQSAVYCTNRELPDMSATVNSDKKKMYFDSVGCNYSEIQIATDNFSSSNILGEDGIGVVYKGQLNNGKLILAKVQKEGSIVRDFAKCHSQLYLLSLVRHKNIIPLLGFCGDEDVNILVYEYVCSKSLEWHLFDNVETVLPWDQRQSIAIGVARGLQFLHQECWSGPIVHRDMRPGNISITRDYKPLLGDFGLSQCKKYDKQNRIISNLGYNAAENAEKGGTCPLQEDIYAFGIVLIQLISGKKADSSMEAHKKDSLKPWALEMIETLDFDEFVDPRLGNSYCRYEVYNMSRAVYMCTHTKPEERPAISEVLRILEGENDHRRYIKGNLFPVIISPDLKLN